MVTVWGAPSAPGAAIVTEPLAEIPLTVTVCCCPLSSAPFCGVILYAVRDPLALLVMTPSPALVTAKCVLDPRQTARAIWAGATFRTG